MDYLIVTNNPLIEENLNVKFVKGGYLDTILTARDLVHKGHKLISSPLGASIRMLFSPYRSILLGIGNSGINEYYIDTIESSIMTYKKHMEVREVDYKHERDYAVIDRELLEGAINEHKQLATINKMEVGF